MVGAALFGIAIVHTFSTKFFEHLAVTRPRHAGLWHLLGEVEVVFGLWAMVLVLAMFALQGMDKTTAYVDGLHFTEPMFVFAIMVVAGSRPILQTAFHCVQALTRLLPLPSAAGFYLVTLSFVPLLGSFITEPAAMTLAALILRDHYCSRAISTRLMYATVGVLFVNISIGGVLTPFAAPPVLMVAGQWGWDISFMLATFGWKAALAVCVNAIGVTLLFRRELAALGERAPSEAAPVPLPMVALHLGFLIGLVVFAHHAPIFMGLLLFFLGFAHAYSEHHDRLILREGLMVAFFLAGLIVLGGLQQWWLQPLMSGLSDNALFFGTTALTAITDNAALTYLGSLVQGTDAGFRYALVAGAITGGGLTVIANAPNPAGFSILKDSFHEQTIHPLGLLAAAAGPTLVAMVAFWA